MRLFSVFVLPVVLITSGCASYYEYNSKPKPYSFSVGDHVRLWTEKTGEVQFEVTKVTDSTVYGEGIEIPIGDIQEASTRKLNERKVDQTFERGLLYIPMLSVLLLVAGLAFLAP